MEKNPAGFVNSVLQIVNTTKMTPEEYAKKRQASLANGTKFCSFCGYDGPGIQQKALDKKGDNVWCPKCHKGLPMEIH
jgi:hypothetical protein